MRRKGMHGSNAVQQDAEIQYYDIHRLIQFGSIAVHAQGTHARQAIERRLILVWIL
jgi:hypothetical protein